MIYKRYELSLSLNGEKIVHIARNASGIVVFRENSEKELMRAIDEFEKEKEQKELEANSVKDEEVKPEEEQKEESQEEPQTEKIEENNAPEVLLPAQKRITRGPDGKFISKSQLDQEAPKKKGFWDKLTG